MIEYSPSRDSGGDGTDVDRLTSHMNHQLVTPIAGVASSCRNLAEDLSDSYTDGSASGLSEKLIQYRSGLIELATEIQDFRQSYKDTGEIGLPEVLRFLQDTVVSTFTDHHNEIRLLSEQIDTEHYKSFRNEARLLLKQANQCQRMIRNVWQSSLSIDLRLLKVNLGTIVELAFRNARSNFDDETVTFRDVVTLDFDVPLNGSLVADYDKLTEVFQNLFENSDKYVGIDRSNKIIVSADVVAKSAVKSYMKKPERNLNYEKFVRVKFFDGGELLPRKEWSKIFDMGFRGANSVRGGKDKKNPQGTGYGLYYCRKVLQAHAGGIYYTKSNEKKGSGQFVIFFALVTQNGEWLPAINRS